ncbi:MAG: DUF4956 domain-containing protein [Ignavibacteriales bacterium]|nr:MAG: DUF4956 domain-containing protein [Ignavibacteriales bacterium]
MSREFQGIVNFSVSFGDVFANLIVSFLCGLIIAFFYKTSYKGTGYTNSFVISLITLSLITTIVIMVIGNNLARAFGLVGAMSIIRFRTAVKDTLDIVFIFYSLAIGMATGVGLLSIAIAGTIFIGVVLLALSKFNSLPSTREEYLLQFYYTDDSNEVPYQKVIKKYCKSYKLINVKSLGSEEGLELSYYVQLRNKDKNNEFLRDLKNIVGIEHINLFFDEEHF